MSTPSEIRPIAAPDYYQGRAVAVWLAAIRRSRHIAPGLEHALDLGAAPEHEMSTCARKPPEQRVRREVILDALLNQASRVAGDIVEIQPNTWAIHGVIPVDGDVILGELATRSRPWQFSSSLPFRRRRARELVTTSPIEKEKIEVADDTVTHNLERMHELDFTAWNGGDWDGAFARLHTDDVVVQVHGQRPTHGIREHIDAMKVFVESTGGTPMQVSSHPIAFGAGEWTCVVGELEGGGRMVTVAKWTDGAIAEEYIWM
jgi:hypothetical protein